jgi:hypothetical protein
LFRLWWINNVIDWSIYSWYLVTESTWISFSIIVRDLLIYFSYIIVYVVFFASATKACFLSSLVFLLSHIRLLHFERELIYLCIASMFIYVRVITLFFKQYDPLMPFENLSTGLLFSSWIDIIVSILFCLLEKKYF